jgi:3-oxoadipate enol-lactonase
MTALGDILTPAHRSAGDGPETILFLHGLGGDRTCFDSQVGAFGTRFRHLAWDMPGYGESPPLPEMTFPALAAAAVRLLDAVGVARAHLVGHSLGGMVAQEIAITAPHRVASLVLSATSPAFGTPGGEWQKRFLAERLAPLEQGLTPADLAPELIAGLVGEAADAAGVRAAVAAMGRVAPATYRAALQCLVTFDRRDSLAAIAAPTLVLAGERDAVAPPEMMARMAGRIRGARLQTIAGAGHLANLERPAAFNAAVSAFLDEVCRESDHGLRPDRPPARAD